ncbi:MAG: sigma-70 family RNA polymerase sigma factor [Myxococcota bacterium]
MSPKELRCLPGGATGEVDPTDLAALYQEHVDFVWRIAKHMGAPPQDVGDIVHDVFLIAYRRRHDFDRERKIRNWLFGITRNVVARARTGVHRERRLQAVPSPQAPVATAETVLQQSQAHALLQTFLAGLPEEQRAVFVLHDVEGVAAPDVAVAVGAKTNTVYSRLRLARKKFERFAARYRAEVKRHGE